MPKPTFSLISKTKLSRPKSQVIIIPHLPDLRRIPTASWMGNNLSTSCGVLIAKDGLLSNTGYRLHSILLFCVLQNHDESYLNLIRPHTAIFSIDVRVDDNSRTAASGFRLLSGVSSTGRIDTDCIIVLVTRWLGVARCCGRTISKTTSQL